jgi:hypothetical protein
MVVPAEACDETMCHFVDDALSADTNFEYKVVAVSSVGKSEPAVLEVKTTKGRPAQPRCEAGEVFSRAFWVKCLTGDDWGAKITDVVYNISHNGEILLPKGEFHPTCRNNESGGIEVNSGCDFYLMDGLNPATKYEIESVATNEVGPSWRSELKNVTTIAGRPTPPEGVSNAKLILGPPPLSDKSERDHVELMPGESPTSRRLALSYTTSTVRGSDLKYCNVRVRGLWPLSTRFEMLKNGTAQIECDPGYIAPTFDWTRIVDHDGWVKETAKEHNREILNANCWIEERVYRHAPEDTIAQWMMLDDEDKKRAALKRWGIPPTLWDTLVYNFNGDAETKLLQLGGPEVGDGAGPAEDLVGKENPESGGSTNRWVQKNKKRTWVVPLTHTPENLVKGVLPADDSRWFSPDNPHLFSSTSYQVSVTCANLCDWEKLIKEENLYLPEEEQLNATEIGEQYCESDYSPSEIITTKADPPMKPSPSEVMDATHEAIALQQLMPHPMPEPIVNWTVSIACVKGWCPELMCGSITPDMTFQQRGCDGSGKAGYCPGECVDPRIFEVPVNSKKRCHGPEASDEAFGSMCARRNVGCGDANSLDMDMMVGCSNPQELQDLCCSVSARDGKDFDDCHNFGNDFACDELSLGEPYGWPEIVMRPSLVVSPETLACTNNCDERKKEGMGCCAPSGTVRLMPGTTYRFQSMGSNVAGYSPWSDPVEVTTCAVAPWSPQHLTVELADPALLDAHSKGVVLSWHKPSYDGGARVFRYVVEMQAELAGQGTGEWTELSLGDYPALQCQPSGGYVSPPAACDPKKANEACGTSEPGLSVTVLGLVGGSVYKFRIKSVNEYGESTFVSFDSHRQPNDEPSAEADAGNSNGIIDSFGDRINKGGDSDPPSVVTPGDTDTIVVPEISFSECDFDSCVLSWGAASGAATTSEDFYYVVEYQHWLRTPSQCHYGCDDMCLREPAPGAGQANIAMELGNTPGAWLQIERRYAGDSCNLEIPVTETDNGKERTIKATNCFSVRVTNMTLSPTSWNTMDEATTIATTFMRSRFRLRVYPAKDGACSLRGATCEPKEAYNWAVAPLNTNIFATCTCNGRGKVAGEIGRYKNPFLNGGTGSVPCLCDCEVGYLGDNCETAMSKQHCSCVGDPHCHTLPISDYTGSRSRYFDYYCPGEHVLYNSALFGKGPDGHGRERAHNWMHRLRHVTAQNKAALRWYNDDDEPHTFLVDIYGYSQYQGYTGKGPMYGWKDGVSTKLCEGSTCACYGTWKNAGSGGYQAYYVDITKGGKHGYLAVFPSYNKNAGHMKRWMSQFHGHQHVSVGGTGFINTLTGTEIGTNQWGHYMNVYYYTYQSRNGPAMKQVNQALADPGMTGMCGSEGAQLSKDGNRDVRPSNCGQVNSGSRPFFITLNHKARSLFTFYGNNNKFCTGILSGGSAWSSDTYWGYSGNRYHRSFLSEAEGLTHEVCISTWG